jgi:hypothetical protein
MDDEPLDLGNPHDANPFTPIDVYCFSLICYEILSGNKVFSPRLSAAELRGKAVNNHERPQVPSCIKGDFGTVIKRRCDSDPSKRPHIGEIWDTLEHMNFQIIDGVDSDLVRERIEGFSAHRHPQFVEEEPPESQERAIEVVAPAKENDVPGNSDLEPSTTPGTVVPGEVSLG